MPPGGISARVSGPGIPPLRAALSRWAANRDRPDEGPPQTTMRHSFLSLAPAPTVGSGGARQHPFGAALVVTVIGYVIVTAVIVGLGLLLTHPLNGSVGGWDW